MGPISLSWFKFNPGLAKNHMSSKVWDEVTSPFPNFNGVVVEYSSHDLLVMWSLINVGIKENPCQ